MKQIRVHGRGGQGVVTAAELIAVAAFKDGYQAQAFPSFGVERTGAPVESYARIDDKIIRTKEQVYSPDFLIIQDATLLNSINVFNGSHKDTIVIINTTKTKEELALNLPAKNIFPVNASGIALEIIGKNIMNTVILGTFAKATGLISLASLKSAIKEKFAIKGEDIVNKNIAAIEKAYQQN